MATEEAAGAEPTAPGRSESETPAPPAESTRIRLARLARDEALAVDGVASVGPHRRPDRGTHGGGERIDGVVCVAEPDGRYGLALYIGAEPVPLYALAEQVRKAVATAAERQGLAAELGSIDVVVDELVEVAGGS